LTFLSLYYNIKEETKVIFKKGGRKMLKKLTKPEKSIRISQLKERTAMDYCGAICAANCDIVEPQAALGREIRYP
jgi:hypothetical protein